MPRSLLPILALSVLAASSALATTESASYPWQLLSGGYNSSVNDGRILGYPAVGAGTGDGFFALVENSIMTMTADNGGFSRSALAAGACESCKPGDSWENSNGGRGFTDSFCGGYENCSVLGGSGSGGSGLAPGRIGFVLAGPPSVMDDGGNNYSPKDVATGGWPDFLRTYVEMAQAVTPRFPMCIAPAGLPDAHANDCAPGLTYRTGYSHLFASPDAGRQWYPFASSCGIPWGKGADHIAADPANPGHVVVSWRGDAAECGDVAPCAQRRIAWTGDIGPQLVASIVATTSPTEEDTTHAVDLAGGGASDNDPRGWHYASLGHLALDAPTNTGGQHCDAEHAGIQVGCNADTSVGQLCHAAKPSAEASQERFCPDKTSAACSCQYTNDVGKQVTITQTLCTFPEASFLAIDPRNGSVYAPSNVGLLFSPDGGRKWRRHGHSWAFKWGPDGGMTASAEPWPYNEDPNGTSVTSPPSLDATNDPGVRILTMQGLPDTAASMGDMFALDLNAQPEFLTDLSRVSFAQKPCSTPDPRGARFQDVKGVYRDRVVVTATFAASWRNPLRKTEILSGVFVAHGDSCTDAAGRAPLVFRDAVSLVPMG